MSDLLLRGGIVDGRERDILVRVVAAGLEVSGAINLPCLEANPLLQPILLIQSFYRLAAELSIARGMDPDRPPHLQKVTRTL